MDDKIDLCDVVREMPQSIKYVSNANSFTLENDVVSIFCFYANHDRTHVFMNFLKTSPKCVLASRAPVSLDDSATRLVCAYVDMVLGSKITDSFVIIPSDKESKIGFPAQDFGEEHSGGFFFGHTEMFNDLSGFMNALVEKYDLKKYHEQFLKDHPEFN